MNYEFRCLNCGHEFFLILDYVTYMSALYFECPRCESCNTKRIFTSPPSVHYKDSDFTKHVKEE